MINHLNLVYFIAAARELNFTRAAEKLYISQQALSNHIASLEKEVGLTLIERKAPMRLTCGGEIFYKYALEMEASYQAMLQELSDVKDEKRGKFAVGISHTRGRLLLPKVLPALMEAMALNYADDTDAKLETFKEILENNSGNQGWLGYNRLFESNLRVAKE